MYSNIKRPGRREGVGTKTEMWSVRREDNQESEALWESLRREEFNLHYELFKSCPCIFDLNHLASYICNKNRKYSKIIPKIMK